MREQTDNVVIGFRQRPLSTYLELRISGTFIGCPFPAKCPTGTAYRSSSLPPQPAISSRMMLSKLTHQVPEYLVPCTKHLARSFM